MTPPPTLPTPTLELPPASPEHDDDWNASLLGLPSSSTAPDPLLSPISPEWTTNGIPYDMPPGASDTSSVLLSAFPYDDNTSPHYLPHLDIPLRFPSPKSPWSESPTSSTDYDELDMLDTPSSMDIDMPLTPESFPTTPELTHDKSFENDFQYGYYDEQRPLHEIDFLPELDDIPNSPSSPSLRSFSTLPALDEDDDDDDELMLPSPGATLVSLPSADLGPSTSLLLLEDEPLPRSPSPENYDVDPASVADSPNSDIRHLGELRSRSLNAERAARQLEQALMDQGAVHQRWEARRARKKEKERGREIGAMLRLKVAEERERMSEGEREGEMSMKRRNSMEKLVAKMMLRRNDMYRSLAHRKTPLTSKFYTSSPLVRFGDLDCDSDDVLESLTSFETGGFESEPWTFPAWTTILPQFSSAS
ncbi:hypothetical protein C0991_008192 [Blastosporella zonata]|nr:hypothetical protein C0991_008192 [Blastosporella zonata]